MKRILLLIFIMLLYNVLIFGGPLKNIPQKLNQPDGTVLNCFASGDEFYNWLHDSNGYTITHNPKTGYWVYAEKKGTDLSPTNYIPGKVDPYQLGFKKWLKPDYSVIKSRIDDSAYPRKRKNMISSAAAPLSKGIINNIVIFIRFADQPEYSQPLSYYIDKFEGSGETSVSFKNYYRSVSYNQLTINSSYYPLPSGDAIVSYKDIHKRSYYLSISAGPDSGYTNKAEGNNRMFELQKRVLAAITPQVPTSLNIDSNNDGKVDNVVFFFAGNAQGNNEVLWPIQWNLSFNAQINGKKVDVFNQQFNDALSIGVLCHEMFHTLSAPDLYHYLSANENLKPVGTWDLMEEDGNEHMLAYMKMQYGKWVTNITEITQTGTYTLNPVGGSDTNNISYKIKSPNSQKEYFMIEYRDKSQRFETNIPSTGVIIYRILPDSVNKGNENGPPDEVYIFRPGGSTTLNGNILQAAFSAGSNRTVFNDSSDPKCFLTSGAPGGINISNIRINGATASFDITINPVALEKGDNLSNEYTLMQNFPNPFNPSTKIKFSIPLASKVSIKIYDMLGRNIKTLINSEQNAGTHEVTWNGDNDFGSKVATGIYLYTISSDKFVQSKKMILLK